MRKKSKACQLKLELIRKHSSLISLRKSFKIALQFFECIQAIRKNSIDQKTIDFKRKFSVITYPQSYPRKNLNDFGFLIRHTTADTQKIKLLITPKVYNIFIKSNLSQNS